MFKIKTMNSISPVGLETLKKLGCAVSAEETNPDGMLIRSADLHSYEFNPELLGIARAGAGYNNIPIEDCAERGIVVFNSPGANAEAVKEQEICSLVMASRDVLGAIDWVRSIADRGEEIPKLVEKGKSSFSGPELLGKNLGVVGLGAVGALVANIALELGMTVYGYDPFMSVEAAWQLSREVIRCENIEEIYQNSDYISLNVPYTETTHHMFNAEAFAKMRRGVRIVNESRAEVVDDEAMTEALSDLKGDMENADKLAALTASVSQYKKADITMPEEGKYYQILSASTYYKAKYEGSSLYASDNNVRFHYTKQYEPEEIWQFEAVTGGYKVKNVITGKALTMPAGNAENMTLTANGSVMKIALATKASGKYTYIPAVLNISSGGKYLTADCTGYAKSGTDAALCYQGTWRIVEVKDFTFMLKHLVEKCETVLHNAKPGEMGEPTEAALSLLSDEIIAPAKALIGKGAVSRSEYDKFLALYAQFVAMPRTSVLDALDEGYYYNLRNAYFTNYLAMASTSNTVQPRTMSNNTDAYQWRIRKNADGTVSIFSKVGDKPAYPASDAETKNILLGKEYSWKLDQHTCDEGKTGIRIISASGAYSWYVNASSWANNVILKPIAWGASIWTFEKLNISTSINNVNTSSAASSNVYYDLQGRQLHQPVQHGVYINGNGEKVIR